MTFEERILHFIKKNKLITPRGLVVLGVSGGADSMALLMGLSGLRHDLGIQLHVAHFNHRLRPESGRDEDFVKAWCKKLNIPLSVEHRPGGKLKHLSEDDARKMRFAFFGRIAKSLNAQSVALAHTQNDLAETVLLRVMRGSGLYGLRAILPKRTIEGTVFVRPLLGVIRRDVEDYLKVKKTPFCIDATNQKALYERNKVRLELLPLLAQKYNPQIITLLSDLAATAAEDYEFISAHARKKFDKVAIVTKGKVKIHLKGVRRLHPALTRLIFRQMAEKLTGDPAVLTFQHIHALENLMAQMASGRVDLSHHLKATKTREYLELTYA